VARLCVAAQDHQGRAGWRQACERMPRLNRHRPLLAHRLDYHLDYRLLMARTGL